MVHRGKIEEEKHIYNVPATTSFGHCHTKVWHNRRMIEICTKHQKIEVSRLKVRGPLRRYCLSRKSKYFWI